MTFTWLQSFLKNALQPFYVSDVLKMKIGAPNWWIKEHRMWINEEKLLIKNRNPLISLLETESRVILAGEMLKMKISTAKWWIIDNSMWIKEGKLLINPKKR